MTPVTLTPVKAFELAIELAVSAPTEEKSRQATELAEGLAMLLTPEQVKEVKAKFEVS